jgi:hypothetical protein
VNTRGTVTRLVGGLVILLVAACGGGASPSPTVAPTPVVTPTPAPTATPDVLGAFLAQMVLPAASGEATMSGLLVVGGIEAPISGQMRFRGTDSQMTMSIAIGGAEQVTEQTTQGTQAWHRTSPGPWLVQTETPDPSKSLAGTLRALSDLEDLGTVRRDGRDLHHLRPKAGSTIAPEVFGLTDPSIKDPVLGLEFFAAQDGTPAIMLMTGTWTQTVNGLDLATSMEIEFAFSTWGGPVTIAAPDDVWNVHTSAALGYSMAYPPEWTVETGADEDTFLVDGDPYIYVSPQKVPKGMTTDQFRDELIKTYVTDLGGPPDANEAAVLGGQPAHRLTYHVAHADGDTAVFDYATVHDGRGWEVLLVTAAGAGEAEDLAFFETFIATFAFTK